MTAPLAVPQPRRWGPLGVIGALVATLVVFASRYQSLETITTGWLIGVVSRVPVATVGASRLIIVNGDSPEGFGLTITNSCSSLPIVIAFAAVSLGLVATGRVPVDRIGRSLATATVLAVAINLVRLAIVGWFTVRWGTSSGFSWSHTYVGSVLTVVGLGAGTVTYGWVLIRKATRPSGRGREDRPSGGEREDRPSGGEREDRPSGGEREDRPSGGEREQR